MFLGDSDVGFMGGNQRANAVTFNGTTDYLVRSALSGGPNTGQGLASFWLKYNGSTGTEETVFSSATNSPALLNSTIAIRNDGSLVYQTQDFSGAGYTVSCETNGNFNFSVDSLWHNALISWNTNLSAGSKIIQIYIDDVTQGGAVLENTPAPALTHNYASDTLCDIGNSINANEFMKCSIAESCILLGVSPDLSTTANRRVFIDGSGKPANVGALSAAALSSFGQSPIIYLPNPVATVGNNSGTGGNLTVVGTPTATTGP